MKHIRLFVATSALAALFACGTQPQNETADIAVPVSVEDIKLQPIQKLLNTTGSAEATMKTDLNSEMAGYYYLSINPATKRPFKLGDRVTKGQVIIHFEDDEYLNGIAIESKKLNLDISQQEYEKQKSLYEKGGVTLRELRNSEVSKTNAEYDYKNAQLKMAKMKVIAPFTGVIVDLPYYTQGTRVTSNQLMVSLMSYDKMFMEINLPEKNITDVQLGQDVHITSYTLPNDTLNGIVSELSPAISSETRTFKGKLTIDNPELKLRPGMFVKADIVIASKDTVIVIPKDVIMTSNRGRVVYVVDQSEARERVVTPGIENQDLIEITHGLRKNERLVVKGFETLSNGSKVKVIR